MQLSKKPSKGPKAILQRTGAGIPTSEAFAARWQSQRSRGSTYDGSNTRRPALEPNPLSQIGLSQNGYGPEHWAVDQHVRRPHEIDVWLLARSKPLRMHVDADRENRSFSCVEYTLNAMETRCFADRSWWRKMCLAF